MNKKIALGIFIFIILFIIPSSVLSYQYDIYFSGIATDKEVYTAKENILVTTTLINSENYVHTNLTLYFKLIREIDQALISSKQISLDLDKKEVKEISESLEIPQRILSGNYSIFIETYSASDSLIAVINKEIKIEAEVEEGIILGKDGVYLKIPIPREITEGIIHTITIYSYGEVGETIPPNNSFFIQFNLKNVGEKTLTPEVKIKIVPTYEKDEITKLINKSLSPININEEKSYSIETKLEKSGTYRGILQLYVENEKILEKEVRIVIGGEGGSILALRNSKDSYKKGEEVKVDISVVGPADKSRIENCYLKLEVIKENKIKIINKEITELSSTPFTVSFKFRALEDLDYYDLLATLGKGDKIFDTARASYKPLEPTLVITEDGRIRNIKVKGCFDDGRCTEDELEIGDCLDCAGVTPKKPEITPSKEYLVYIVLILVALILSFVYLNYKRKRK